MKRFSTGIIYNPTHELHGKSVKDKIVIYPYGCGPVGYPLFLLTKLGGSPRAIINMSPYSQDLADAIFAGIPMVYGFDENLLEIIQTGDLVTVNANNGFVIVNKE